MNTRKKRGTASEHGDDTDPGAEFESFVRDQFKLLLDGQKALRSEVRALEENLEKNVEMLESRLERNEEKSRELETKLREVERQTTEGSERVKSATEEIADLQRKCNKLERFSRRNNIRIIGRKVERGENCLITVQKILREKFGRTDIKIERAHPDGPPNKHGGDKTPQHILFKVNCYQDKIHLMKASRKQLKTENYYFTDDLTAADLQEKRKWRDKVKEAYEHGNKYRFFNGLWRDSQGKPVSFE
ncbi:uncharacterized protein LOC144927618 [Branchiostoma floridae x Branchiostoma belcheri]